MYARVPWKSENHRDRQEVVRVVKLDYWTNVIFLEEFQFPGSLLIFEEKFSVDIPPTHPLLDASTNPISDGGPINLIVFDPALNSHVSGPPSLWSSSPADKDMCSLMASGVTGWRSLPTYLERRFLFVRALPSRKLVFSASVNRAARPPRYTYTHLQLLLCTATQLALIDPPTLRNISQNAISTYC